MDANNDQEISLEVVSPDSRATAVVVQAVPSELANEFLHWQRDVSRAAKEFPGYQRTEVFPPTASRGEWVTIIHFAGASALDAWLNSDVRAEWIAKLEKRFGSFTLQKFSGLDAWFQPTAKDAPPGWKMVLAVVFALYPTVMIWGVVTKPIMSALPFPESMLIGNFASVAILQWGLMPIVTAAFSWWLLPTNNTGVGRMLAGIAILVGSLLAVMAFFLWKG